MHIQEMVTDFVTLAHSPFRALVTLRHSPSLKPSPPDCLHWIQMFLRYRQTDRGRERESWNEPELQLWTDSSYDFVLIWAVRASDKTKSPSISCLSHLPGVWDAVVLSWRFLTNVDGLIADRRWIQTFSHGTKALGRWQHVNKCACCVKRELRGPVCLSTVYAYSDGQDPSTGAFITVFPKKYLFSPNSCRASSYKQNILLLIANYILT